MGKLEDLTGKKFNNVLVISLCDEKDNQGKYLWNCLCDCGKKMKVRSYNLKNTIKSCGCKSNRGDNVALNQKYATYKRDCTKKGLNFDLDKKEFSMIIQGDCHYCGSGPELWSPYLDKDGNIHERYITKMDNNYMKTTSIEINGIDRLDSNKGYNKVNCVPCCGKCNIMKNKYSEDDFLDQIEKIFNFRIK